jgi:SAM-dependent methyltransferase
MDSLRTDWDAYYRRPGRLTGITRAITAHRLERCLRLYRGELGTARVCELGGANSCFYAGIRARLRPARYLILDDNRTGLDLFARNHPNAEEVELIQGDVRELPAGVAGAGDICFSVGLIEHFDADGTRDAVRAHFRAVRPGGLVILFFPTPTPLYRAIRRLAETAGIWAFPDERPLPVAEVVAEVERHGTLVASEINWWIGLTQAIVVAEAATRSAKS